MLQIWPCEKNCVIIDTGNGSFHVWEKDGKTHILMYDHFRIEVEGKHKGEPKITLDSDEYPTRLEVKETENRWTMVKEEAR